MVIVPGLVSVTTFSFVRIEGKKSKKKSKKNTTHTLSKDKVDAVIAEFVVDAPSDNVKTGLKIYQYNKSKKQMESEVQGARVERDTSVP